MTISVLLALGLIPVGLFVFLVLCLMALAKKQPAIPDGSHADIPTLECPTCRAQTFSVSFQGSSHVVCECARCHDELLFRILLDTAQLLGRCA